MGRSDVPKAACPKSRNLLEIREKCYRQIFFKSCERIGRWQKRAFARRLAAPKFEFLLAFLRFLAGK